MQISKFITIEAIFIYKLNHLDDFIFTDVLNTTAIVMVSSKLSPNVVEDLCKRYSHHYVENAFEIINYTLKESSDAPAGFLGRHETLWVQIRRIPSAIPEEMIFFTKSVPSDVTSRAEYIEEFGVFKKEISVYRDLLPRLQMQSGLPDFAAKCYYAKGDLLIFDHLGEMGFRMGADRSGILDFDHLRCALTSVTRLHAASVLFEAKNSTKIPDMFPEAVQENAYPTVANSIRLVNFNNAIASICELIKIMPEYRDSDRLEYILQEFPIRMGKIFDLCKPSTKYYNVFSHGDLWANNLLFKYKNDCPVESKLVDFQLTRYAPPILDVITLLTIPTSRQFRCKHLNTLLECYYGVMEKLLRQNGVDINDYIPKAQFEESVAEFMLCGLIESCLFSHLTILPPELTQNLTSNTEGFEDFFTRMRSEICLKAFQSDEVYRTRLTDMISDIIDNYIVV